MLPEATERVGHWPLVRVPRVQELVQALPRQLEQELVQALPRRQEQELGQALPRRQEQGSVPQIQSALVQRLTEQPQSGPRQLQLR